MREIKIGDCVNDKLGAYLGRVVSVEKEIAKVRMYVSGNLEKLSLGELFLSHY